ncbi:MAG: alpha/beta hydrolase [Erythrobacter sp.]|nr:alpha/beta hydrolase [Erythrobacter sp.]MDZ4273621.1 alpha/beta hydrolase [Erythrobacter sp.]
MTSGNEQPIEQARTFYAAMRGQPPVRFPRREEDDAAIRQSSAFRFGPGRSLAARTFGASDAPVVALMHGWGGQSTQFYRMALALAEAGYRAIVVDCGNHGDADPMPLGFDRFMLDAAALADHLGAMPFAWVSHSAAALAIMSARRTHGLSAQAYVTIAAPFTPYVPLNRLRALGADQETIDAVKPLLASEFACDWNALEAGLAWQRDESARLLAVYDDDDTMARSTDAERIAAVWPDCLIYRTTGNGHNRILKSEQAIMTTLEFLESSVSWSADRRQAGPIKQR